MKFIAILSFLMSLNVYAAHYEINITDIKTGEIRSFIPTNKERYEVPMKLGYVNCQFREVTVEKKYVYGTLTCMGGQMSFGIKVTDGFPGAMGELALVEQFEHKKTKKVVDAYVPSYLITLTRSN